MAEVAEVAEVAEDSNLSAYKFPREARRIVSMEQR